MPRDGTRQPRSGEPLVKNRKAKLDLSLHISALCQDALCGAG
jgi:hypothetical protein